MDEPAYTDRAAEQVALHERLAQVYQDKRYAPAYSRIYQRHWNERLCGISLCREGARVLDLGCGTGVLFPELQRRLFDIVGVDVSPAMLSAAKQAFPSVSCVCVDAADLPFADSSFDAVFCRGSLHHLADLSKAFHELSRILKKGGVLVFSEPSNDSPINRAFRHLMYKRSAEFCERDEGFRRKKVLPIMIAAGLNVEYSRGFGFLAYTFAGFPDKLGILNHVPFASALTRILICLDDLLEKSPAIHLLGLHWQVRARKI